jgi:succinate-semialdehyde dehydrogenase/glutarate-semialdehyde dehydrogenase
LIDQRGFDKVQNHVEDAVGKGAAVLTGGRPARINGDLKGYFYEPTVLANTTHQMKVMYEETFGPVLPVMPFDTEDEAIALANDTSYGLAAYFYARDIGRVFRVSEKLEYGIVGANDPLPVGAHIPFGGYKESGLGRENGSEGIDHFLEVKAISIGL